MNSTPYAELFRLLERVDRTWVVLRLSRWYLVKQYSQEAIPKKPFSLGLIIFSCQTSQGLVLHITPCMNRSMSLVEWWELWTSRGPFFPDGHKISTIPSQHKVVQRKVGKRWENGCMSKETYPTFLWLVAIASWCLGLDDMAVSCNMERLLPSSLDFDWAWNFSKNSHPYFIIKLMLLGPLHVTVGPIHMGTVCSCDASESRGSRRVKFIWPHFFWADFFPIKVRWKEEVKIDILGQNFRKKSVRMFIMSEESVATV